jgi:formyltetrahydrofolate-dependent phosphoribosylglycinamide formyltransferase
MTTPLPFPLSPLRISVLISGGGTTLRNLLQVIDRGELDAAVDLVIASSPTAGGLNIAKEAGIPSLVHQRQSFANVQEHSDAIFASCREAGSHLVVMGGFLKLVRIPDDFHGRVVNIHPALIPSFCGKGFFGRHVHQAVLDYGCKVTGCTVHFVDNQYDHGPVIMQRCVPVEAGDTPESLAARVFEAECSAYPEALRLFAAGRLTINGRSVDVASR